MIKSVWCQRYMKLPEPATGDQVVLSLDTALKADARNDYTDCTVWRRCGNGHYLQHLYGERLEFPDLKRQVQVWARSWNASAVLVEDAGAGSTPIQDLRGETGPSVIGIVPKNGKQTRMMAVRLIIEAGRVSLPDEATWRRRE